MTIFNIIKGNGGDVGNNNNQTLSHHKLNLENCSPNDSFSREELRAIVKHLSVDTPELRIHEFNEIKDIGIAAVILTVIAYFYMWCICCRLDDFEKQLQSNENILNNRIKKVRAEALKKTREEVEGNQKMTVEDVELEKSPSPRSANPTQSEENHEVVHRGEFNMERRLVVISSEDLEPVEGDSEGQPEIKIANSVVYINNNSRPSTPAFERVSSAITALGELENNKK